eukprot:CAMPEP_0204153036 /NCGR_PEP_ID=MMETSP0361-20130328/27509_1 /ASSEMBLY_ACC=CAM_ASM_000343 /TAXON_ID=268821 /ORGANISM="Scrippsiella Hangoei, Strain SHTV-5" /LENGTH=182 /DNA_ID=CAMNT_0051108085 /DNA_START=1 /DNA_END=546 /DNA_ORIENTATION=+
MHSMNHTKRISVIKAYDRNVRLLREISGGGVRWKSDGLSNLKFRIVDYEKDDEDLETHHIVIHKVKVRRGSASHNVNGIALAVPPVPSCGSSKWTWTQLGKPVPWELEALRGRAVAAAGCRAPVRFNFVLIDVQTGLAKVVDDSDARLLYIFFRSLVDPEQNGLIVADARPRAEIEGSLAKL